jgi:hypothetical protein
LLFNALTHIAADQAGSKFVVLGSAAIKTPDCRLVDKGIDVLQKLYFSPFFNHILFKFWLIKVTKKTGKK